MKQIKNITDKNPFKVPDNYFDEVNSKIIAATSEYNREVRKLSLYSRFKPYLLIAASITGFIILSYTAVRLLTPDRSNLQLSDIIYETYPDSYIDDIDLYTLEKNAADLVLYDEGPGVSNKDIIDYLLQENIEINDIYEQL